MSGSIKGVGCDIVGVSRIAELIADQRFLDKVYTVYEQAYISEKGQRQVYGQQKKLSVKLLEPDSLDSLQRTLRLSILKAEHLK